MKKVFFLCLIYVFMVTPCLLRSHDDKISFINNRDSYNFVHENIGTEPLDNVSVGFGKFQSACGCLYPEMKAHHMMVERTLGDVPEQVNVRWTRVKDGQKFNKIFKVKSELPQGPFKGDIIFLFDNDQVELKWESR